MNDNITRLFLNPVARTTQNDQAHPNNLSAIADELLVCLIVLWDWRLKG